MITGKSAKQPLLAVTRIVTIPITVGFGKLTTFGVKVKSAVVGDVGVTEAVPFISDPGTTENVRGNKPGEAAAAIHRSDHQGRSGARQRGGVQRVSRVPPGR